MTALEALDPDTAPTAAAALLAEARAAFGGSLPNLTKVMANSPPALRGYLQLAAALDDGVVPPPVRERIALLVAEQNGCTYCLSAHTFVAERVLKLSAAEIAAARRGDSADPRIRVVLQLASAVNTGLGRVNEEVLDDVRRTGMSDEEIAEIIAHVAVNTMSNLFARASRVAVDFPLVVPGEAAA
jgi:uncharacterized peroxidase-related enzyme